MFREELLAWLLGWNQPISFAGFLFLPLLSVSPPQQSSQCSLFSPPECLLCIKSCCHVIVSFIGASNSQQQSKEPLLLLISSPTPPQITKWEVTFQLGLRCIYFWHRNGGRSCGAGQMGALNGTLEKLSFVTTWWGTSHLLLNSSCLGVGTFRKAVDSKD